MIEEKVVAVERTDTQIKEVTVYRDRYIEKEKLIVKEDIRNLITYQIKEVPTIQDRIVPVVTNNERIVEIPYLLEKIVEKITILPQVVEVIKYVHEIVEEATLGIAVGVDVNVEEIRYKELYVQLRVNFDIVLVELRKLRGANPALKIIIDIIENYMIELDRLIQFPRFITVEKEVEKEVEVIRSVLVPTRDEGAVREETALAVLVEKLIGEIRSIKKNNPSVKLNLDEDLQLIFFSEAFNGGKLNEDITSQLRSFREGQYSKWQALGGKWSNDHDFFIKSVLDDRFALATAVKTANLEIERAKAIAAQRLEGYRGVRQTLALLETKFQNLESEVATVHKNFEKDAGVAR